MRATRLFHQSASAASLNWRQESRFRIVISEGGFRSKNALCLFAKTGFRAQSPFIRTTSVSSSSAPALA